jgi:quinol monooxygenase YgiN
MSGVTLHGFLICRTLEEADRVSVLLPDHIAATRAERGCLWFEVHRSTADPVRFAVYEVFQDKAAFEAHRVRMKDTQWWRVTQNIPRDYTTIER